MSTKPIQTNKHGVSRKTLTEMINEQPTICGMRIQHDASGIGHHWRVIDTAEIPADIQDEIAAEIIDGQKESCKCFVATNGLHYRW